MANNIYLDVGVDIIKSDYILVPSKSSFFSSSIAIIYKKEN